MQTVLAPAKINLTLHVGPAKDSGRHDLDSLVVFAGAEAADRITVEPADTLQIGVIGQYADACGPVGENLVFKAAHGLKTILQTDKGARITLVKHLPFASGIGGGSADAAATLRALNALWDGPSSPDHLLMLAEKLGGDVPACLYSEPLLMHGEGERIIRADLPGSIPALLVNPGIACPTGPIFQAYDVAGGGADFVETGPPAFASLGHLFEWLEGTYNDLEAPAMARHPEIASVLTKLRNFPNTRIARMSGSGATCFALFDTMEDARASTDMLKAEQPDWWVVATQFGNLA